MSMRAGAVRATLAQHLGLRGLVYDHVDLGDAPGLGQWVAAPSTPGTFLRSFSFGHAGARAGRDQ